MLYLCFHLAGKSTAGIASHVLQFIFVGNNGFRIPVCHFPTKEVDPATLMFLFWRVVGWLGSGGFKVQYACLDGGSANRSFVLAHFRKSMDVAVAHKFAALNLHTGGSMVFIFDPWVSTIVFCYEVFQRETTFQLFSYHMFVLQPCSITLRSYAMLC